MPVDIKSHPSILNLYLSKRRFQKQADGYVTNCVSPKHKDKNPSFRLFLDLDGKTWLYKCWSCGVVGDIISFIETVDGVDFKTAVKTVQEYCGGTWESTKKAEDVFRPVNEQAPKAKIPLSDFRKFEEALEKSDEARIWLAQRGISYNTAKLLRFGYRGNVGKLSSDTSLADQGWLALPCIQGADVVSVEYRSLRKKAFTRQPGMFTSLFTAGDVDALTRIYVCEGKLDAAVLFQAGYVAVSLPNATTKLTPEMKDQIMQAGEIILAGDTDSAGMECMTKLWAELKDRTYLLTWPGVKDANEFFLKTCAGDQEKFRNSVEELTQQAKAVPMPGIYSLAESLASSSRTNLADHPNRLRFPWNRVDNMAVLLPGSVLFVSATNTKMGKTQWVLQSTLHAAMKHQEVVLNYQAELDISEISSIVTAHVLHKDRNHLSQTDYQDAQKSLAGVNYYIGRDTTLTTITPVLDLMEAGIRRFGATVAVIDHIHFITSNSQNEIQDQVNAMQRIKNMAVQYGVKFIVVGQPRKPGNQKQGKVIHISDLKGTEAFGSTSDAIVVLHRETIPNKTEDDVDAYRPETEVHLLAARSKGDGSAFTKLMFLGKMATFAEISYDRPDNGLF